ncbi:hypothetical protein KXV70_006986, partial [Aspergillus fumigatus]
DKSPRLSSGPRPTIFTVGSCPHTKGLISSSLTSMIPTLQGLMEWVVEIITIMIALATAPEEEDHLFPGESSTMMLDK